MTSPRVPPHDPESERALVAAVLLDRSALDVIAGILRPEQFYSEAHRRIFEGALELYGRGVPVDVVSVAGWLRDCSRLTQVGGPTYLAELADAVPAVAHIETYARRVKDKWRVRQLIATCQRIAAEGYGDVGDVNEFIDQAEHAVYEVAREAATMVLRREGEYVRTAFTSLVESARRGQRLTGIPTGFDRLDRMLSGLHDGELTIVAGRPGMGKSAAASAIARNVAAWDGDVQLGVAFFSLEMPGEQIGMRDVCAEARIDLRRVRAGFIRDTDWSLLTPAASQVSSLDVWIGDCSSLTVLEMRAAVRRLQSEYDRPEVERESVRVKARRVGLVIVDYLQLMTGIVAKGGNREQEIASISRGLKRLAKELKVPVIALSQLNRSVEMRGKDKRPGLSDLRESGAIEQDADNIIFVYRDDYYEPDSQEKGIAEFIVAKQRQGPTGTVKVRFTDAFTRFDNLAPGEHPEEAA